MYTTILHATDLSQYHYALSQKAADMAHRLKAKLYLLHVIQPPTTMQIAQGLGFADFDAPVKDNAQTVMNVLGEALNVPSEQLLVEIGSIKHTILNKAEKLGCQLIIVGSHTPSHLQPFLGSIAHAVVHHAHCDVLTLRTDTEA